MLKRITLILIVAALTFGSAFAARDFESVNTEYLSAAANTPLDGGGQPVMPYSAACWFNADDANGEQSLWFQGDASDTGDRDFIVITADKAFAAGARVTVGGNDGSGLASSTADHTASTWQLAVGVWTATNDRDAALNAGNIGTDTDNRTHAGFDVMCIGRQCDSTPNYEFDGAIGPCGVWDIALDATDISNLWNSGTGVAFDTVEGADLINCWELDGSGGTEADSVGSITFTVNGTLAQVDNTTDATCLTVASSSAVKRRRNMQ